MDYSHYNNDYIFMITRFNAISKVLKGHLMSLRAVGINLANSYVFGFSFGARLIVRAGNELGVKQLGIIHRSYTFLFIELSLFHD